MRTDLNQDWKKRDKILWFNSDQGIEEGYDIYHFSGVTLETLEKLVNENFMDVEERQNSSPSVKEFMEFMKDHPDKFTAHGYAISHKRQDYRVSIEGIQQTGKMTYKEMADFAEFAHGADEFKVKIGYCWWD